MAVTARGWAMVPRSSSDLDNTMDSPRLSGSPLSGSWIRAGSSSSRSLNQSKSRTTSLLDRESYKCLAFLLNTFERRLQPAPRSLENTAGSVLQYLASSPSRRSDTWKYPTFSADLTIKDDFGAPDLNSLDHSDSDMASTTSSKRSARLPSEAFHMNTRRRAKVATVTPTPSSALPKVPQKPSPASTKGPTAKSRKGRATKAPPATAVLKSGAAPSTATGYVLSDPSPTKTTPTSVPMSRDPPSLVPSLSSTSSPSSHPTPLLSTPEPVFAPSPSLKRKTRAQTSKDKAEESANPPTKRAKTASEPVVEEEIDWLHPKNPIFYGADGRPQDTTASNDPPSGTGSPARKGRGGGNGKKRGGFGGAGGRGRGGRARGGGRAGRDGDDQPEKKTVLSAEAKEAIAALKARQQELKKIFHVVGEYQIDLLDNMSNRDLAKLIRKPGAHKKVPEYEELLEALDDLKEKAHSVTRESYRVALEAEERLFEGEKAVIEQRYRTTLKGAREEHVQGAEGDIEILRNVQASFEDDGHSVIEEDDEELPRFDEAHEPETPVRGYYSGNITDETSLRHLYSANKVAPVSNNHADQARREVIDQEVLSPVKTAFFEKVRAQRELEAHKRTQNIDELSQVGTDELLKLTAYLLPRHMTSNDLNSWSLSQLADASEFRAHQARKYPNNMYMYMPLPPGEQLPANTYGTGPPPGSRGGDKTVTSLASSRPLPPPPPSAGSAVSQPRQQFIFQQQQSQQQQQPRARSSISSNPAPPPPAAKPATPAPASASTATTSNNLSGRTLIPVTFVNSTVASAAIKRRGNNSSNNSNNNNNAGNGAAGGAGAAVAPGQRVLLPKGYVGLPRG